MRLFFYIAIIFIANISVAQEGDFQSFLLDESLTKNASAIIRSDVLTIDLLSIDEMSVHRRKVITVLDKGGDQYAMAYVGYDDGRKVKNIHAIVYDASGKPIDKIKENKFNDVSAVDGSTLYSDSRVKYYRYTPVQYPYTLEVVYEVKTKNTGEIRPVWTFLADFTVSTEYSKLQINFSTANLKPVLKEMNLEGVDLTKKETGQSIVYEAKNVSAIKEESLSPSFTEIAPHVKIRPVEFQYAGYNASINNWNDLGRWMHSNLLSGRDEITPLTKGTVKKLVEGADNNLEKAKIIYEYVQNNTRYISVQVGIGGIQPISAIEVDRVKYGDCKGLSNYTKALLSAVGVESYYTHVEAGKNKVDFDESFPDLAQGNHVILAIPYKDKYYWIDCTSQVHPFGFIGDFTDGRKVFIIKPDGGEIVTTAAYVDDQNFQKTKGSYTLEENGTIVGNLSIHTQGIQYDNRFGLEKQPHEKITKYYKNYWDNINDLNVKSFAFENDKNTVVFTEKVSVQADNYASKSGDRLIFAANAFNKNRYVPKRYRSRKLPFQLERGFLDEDEMEIKFPEGYQIEALPKAVNIDNKFGSYSMSYEMTENKIILKRRFFVKNGNYPNTEYEAYRKFMKTVTKCDGSKIVIKTSV